MKIFKYFLVLVALLIVTPFLFFPPKYVYRVMVWQDADYNDFEKFKFTSISKSDLPYQFALGTEEQKSDLNSAFSQIEIVKDLDSFLNVSQTYSFIVIRNDTILYENYFANQTRDDLQTTFSASKSILSLLIGIAIDQGKIKDIQEPITNYIPELAERDHQFQEISISDLLRMKSGIAYDGKVKFPILNCDDPLTYMHTDLRSVAISKPKIESKSNLNWKYNNYNALLIGLILERAVGESVSTFFERELWKKIGSEYDASWSTDENGFEKMESGFNARSIDLAKLGRLLLNHGQLNNEQIVSSEWVYNSTLPMDTLVYRSGHKWGYSHMWWSVVKDKANSDIFGCGRFSQFIYVSPSTNTIIVRNGLESDNLDDDDWTQIFAAYTDMQTY